MMSNLKKNKQLGDGTIYGKITILNSLEVIFVYYCIQNINIPDILSDI